MQLLKLPSPTPSIFGDDDGDDYSHSSSPSKLQPEVREATRRTKELAMTYDYRIQVGISNPPNPQPCWDYTCIAWTSQEPGEQLSNTQIIGILAIMNDINNRILRIHEA